MISTLSSAIVDSEIARVNSPPEGLGITLTVKPYAASSIPVQGSTVIIMLSDEVHPLASVAVTIYVPPAVTVIEDVVAALDQTYELNPAPALRVIEFRAQIV